DHRGAIGAPGIENRVGPADRVLDLRVVAEPPGPAPRRFLTGQLDERVDAGPRDSGDDGTVVGPDPGLSRQGVRDARPATPLVVERDAGVHHRPPLRQEDVFHRPVEAAGRTHAGHVPAPLDDLRFRAREDPAPVDRGTIRTPTRLAAVQNLKAGQHPRALLAAGAEGPATGDSVTTRDGYGPPSSDHGRAGDGDIASVPVNLLDALVRQP